MVIGKWLDTFPANFSMNPKYNLIKELFFAELWDLDNFKFPTFKNNQNENTN